MAPNTLRAVISYFPLRYYSAAIFFSFIFLYYLEYIAAFEETLVRSALALVISSPHLTEVSFAMPVVAQLLFVIFFPIMAIVARTSFRIRMKLLMFGALCFFLFVVIQLVISLASLVIEPLQSPLGFRVASIAAAILVGGLMIEVALFSSVRIPTPTRIKPMIKRRYTMEYAIFIIVLVVSSAILYGIIDFVGLDATSSDSASIDLVHLGFWLNVPIVVTFCYFIANLFYEIRRPVDVRKHRKKSVQDRPLSVTFLISAYNEENLVAQCIRSIDMAASKYTGKVDIVLVNDGSKDRTEEIVAECFRNLKNCSGKYYTIPNSGKGYALAYGLERTSGDIIFRTDADSVLDENALGPMMSHFENPEVGSVSAWVMPLRGEGPWIKSQNILCSQYFYTKRAQEMMDGIITQPGPSSAYRRDVLMAAGGWVKNIFGEDGEITHRVARLGYRVVFEGDSLVYSRLPVTLVGFMQQRARWSVAFFHSRGRNIRLARELRNSRSLVFLWNLLSHGMSLGRGLLWPYMAVSIIMGLFDVSTPELITLGVIVTKLLAIQVAVTVLYFVLWSYRLKKIGAFGDMKYFPVVRFLTLILNWIVKPQAAEILLTWSARWNDYNDASFKDLRREVHRSVDPRYPPGDYEEEQKQQKQSSSAVH